MISGTPFGPESSFFELAISKLRLNRSDIIQSSIVSLQGFDAPRAARNIKHQIIKARPDIIVVQFGSTDAAVPIRKRLARRQRLARFASTTTMNPDSDASFSRDKPCSRLAPRWIHLLKWRLKIVIADLFLLHPITTEKAYIDAITGMIKMSLSLGVTPIVLSPFPIGSSDRFAKAYGARLRTEMQHINGSYFIDAHSELSQHPKSKTLCQDGLHISKFSHELLGNRLVIQLEKLMPRCSR